MKMLIMMFRQSLEPEVLGHLHDLDVNAFTLAPKVLGQGKTGKAFGSYESPGCNGMLFTALDDDREQEVIASLRAFHDTLRQRQHGAKIPFHIFSLHCDQMQ
jgi:hypothetical protein